MGDRELRKGQMDQTSAPRASSSSTAITNGSNPAETGGVTDIFNAWREVILKMMNLELSAYKDEQTWKV